MDCLLYCRDQFDFVCGAALLLMSLLYIYIIAYNCAWARKNKWKRALAYLRTENDTQSGNLKSQQKVFMSFAEIRDLSISSQDLYKIQDNMYSNVLNAWW